MRDSQVDTMTPTGHRLRQYILKAYSSLACYVRSFVPVHLDFASEGEISGEVEWGLGSKTLGSILRRSIPQNTCASDNTDNQQSLEQQQRTSGSPHLALVM